jgi:hypothetical protein
VTVKIVRATDTAMMIGLIGSKDEEDAVEEDLGDDIDSMYNVADAGDHGELENADDKHSETGEAQTRRRMFFKGRTLLEQDTSQLCSSSQKEHNSASSRVCG